MEREERKWMGEGTVRGKEGNRQKDEEWQEQLASQI